MAAHLTGLTQAMAELGTSWQRAILIAVLSPSGEFEFFQIRLRMRVHTLHAYVMSIHLTREQPISLLQDKTINTE
jgi:hypothetical protein